MMRPIHPGLAPNLRGVDAHAALKRICKPWQYRVGEETRKLEKWFENTYKEDAYAFSSGRGALFAILHNIPIQKGDEVMLAGFTCVAVVDAILATGATPIYVDIQRDFTIDVADAVKKKTKKTKAFILQHTFGISAMSSELDAFIKDNKLFLVEDMAHGIGIVSRNTLIGTNGIAAIFSLGRDKAFSCVSGGIAITKDKALSRKLNDFQERQQHSSLLWIFQNLFHMISFYYLILPLYDFFSIGKIFLVLFQSIGFLSKPIDRHELDHFSLYTAKLAPVLARVALLQLNDMKNANAKRQKIVGMYNAIMDKQHKMPNLPLLRFPFFVTNPTVVKKYMRNNGIYVGDWYSNGIDPKGTSLSDVLYKKGSCRKAEDIAKHVINLPTYPLLSDKHIQKICNLVKTL